MALAQHVEQRPLIGSDQRDLPQAARVKVDCAQKVTEGDREARCDPQRQPHRTERRLLVRRLTGQRGEPQQADSGARGARRYRVVLEILAPRDQLFTVDRSDEEAAPQRVAEALEDLVS